MTYKLAEMKKNDNREKGNSELDNDAGIKPKEEWIETDSTAGSGPGF